jgi:hypothetical protein
VRGLNKIISLCATAILNSRNNIKKATSITKPLASNSTKLVKNNNIKYNNTINRVGNGVQNKENNPNRRQLRKITMPKTQKLKLNTMVYKIFSDKIHTGYIQGINDSFVVDQDYKNRAGAVINEDTGKAMEYRDLLNDPKHRETWSRAAANEFGILFDGVGKNGNGTQQVKGTNTCHWIKKSQVPKGERVTYDRTVVAVRPEKEASNRVRITVGGKLL